MIEGGLEGLLAGWEKTVAEMAAGYPLDTLDDYLNDLDGRQILEEALAVAASRQGRALRQRLSMADARFRALVTLTNRCLWGERAAAENGWTADRSWWYWSRPRTAGAGLLGEIDDRTGGRGATP